MRENAVLCGNGLISLMSSLYKNICTTILCAFPCKRTTLSISVQINSSADIGILSN